MPQEVPDPHAAAPADDVTRVLRAAQAGDARATNELLEVVYDELRKLAK